VSFVVHWFSLDREIGLPPGKLVSPLHPVQNSKIG
jgi:hypothetical protein